MDAVMRAQAPSSFVPRDVKELVLEYNCHEKSEKLMRSLSTICKTDFWISPRWYILVVINATRALFFFFFFFCVWLWFTNTEELAAWAGKETSTMYLKRAWSWFYHGRFMRRWTFLGIERWEVYGDFIVWLLPNGRIICISFQQTHYLLNLFEYKFHI